MYTVFKVALFPKYLLIHVSHSPFVGFSFQGQNKNTEWAREMVLAL